MCLKCIRNYFDELSKRNKIQTREMEKAIGEIVKPKDKKSKKK